MDNDNKEVVIQVKHVSKDFVLPHEKITSIKSAFTHFYKPRSKTEETQHALHDINFEIKKGEFFGIVGRNGSGKSTMLKILANIYQPTAGSISTKGKLVPFIELGVGFNPELTGRENVYLNGAMLGFARKEIDAMYDNIVSFAELGRFMDQKLKNYSSGMQVRLAFSMATRAEADILLVDEVLAVGDADFQRKCFNYFRELKRKNKTVIFVTHDMSAVREYCDRVALIESSKLQKIDSAEIVAQDYAKLFMAEPGADASKTEDEKNRWGDGTAKYSNVTTKKLEDKIIVTALITANADVEKMLYGFHVFSATGKELVATNNQLIHCPDIIHTKKGEKIKITWEVLNVFSDGNYTVTLTLVSGNGTEFDWFNEAASFNVKRMDRSTTPITPPMKTWAEPLKKKQD